MRPSVLHLTLLVLALLALACGTSQKEQVVPSVEPSGETFEDRCDESSAVDANGFSTTFLAVTGSKSVPFRAVAKLTLSTGSLCSAVLVAPDRFISSAHCFEEQGVTAMAEFQDSAADEAIKADIQRIVLHPEYKDALKRGETLASSPGLANVDVAILLLKTSVTDRIPVTMATHDRVSPGQLVSLVGYGDTGGGAGTKRFAQSHVGRLVDDEAIADVSFRNLLLLNSRSGTGACPGDSGGGVFVKDGEGYVLLGVVNGVNDLLYPGFPLASCDRCPQGLGIVTRISGVANFVTQMP